MTTLPALRATSPYAGEALGYGLPQPVTSVTGFAMTGILGDADVFVFLINLYWKNGFGFAILCFIVGRNFYQSKK